jgi:hypothetical protein
MRIIERNFPTPRDPIARDGAGLAGLPPAGPPGPWLFGTVYSVEPSREMLRLHQPEERTQQIVHWLPQTRFVHHGADVRPDALHDGQQISVHAGQKFAREINIVIDPPPAGSSDTGQSRWHVWPFRFGWKARK